ncbi:sensor histidine kinase [Microvirga pakistanensis]|uniref:sensor histidine kinase n=1 Tax=Microvirga pakistanensis TaxID=1682650 RepID=UPI00141B9319|nr:ATP-binding protein [Microvirga pakistanensis]
MSLWVKYHALSEKIFALPPERVIAFARLTLTLFALYAAFLDPPDDTYDAQVTYVVASGYLAFAALGFCLVLARPPTHQEQLIAHIVDICSVCLLMHFNDGPSSPYFIFFTFILLSSSLRWGWRGVLETTFLLILIFFAFILLLGSRTVAIEIADLRLAIFRPVYLVVAGLMLCYVAAVKERSRKQLAKLASWPGPDYGRGLEAPIESALAHAAEFMCVPRVLIIWEVLEEPFRASALWSSSGLKYSREPPDRFGLLVAEPLAQRSFEFPWRGRAVNSSAAEGIAASDAIDKDLQHTFSIQKAITAPFFLPICRGRVFLLDREMNDENDLLLAELVATRIGIDLEHYWLRSELEEAAASRERERLARDLHDGVLQGLAAANIHLSLSADRVEQTIAEKLTQTRELLAAEQKRIRTFVENSRAQSKASAEQVDLAPDVQQMLNRLGQIWGCKIHLAVAPPGLRVSAETARNVRHFLAEAASNAVRHGRASRIEVSVEAAAGRLHLTIADNGAGFQSLHGSYSGEHLSAKNIGPFSLRTRAKDMGGTINLQTSPSGTVIRVEVPL